ncbi:predicted membrane protein [Solibacillus silvestris StLB046]|uniref:Predicted membrane protein n=1 Tax=Solibacillus silvestris (strain StLB046) TaxID=1002809 RepID=F2F1E3_SOLSS|nr:DUF6198 family protein [Solibacillus silvestris]OBW57066.1 hypothetical protein A9986_09995 [Solibacillus silvestris]BAK15281.1 predicted membrane protein [Solibacillus silvestris StLB046]
MNHTIIISKRISIYIIGLFLLSLGATFSILAGIGVSPVTSLPYALALITPLSVGITTVLANFVFIILQAIILKEIRWKNFFIQLIISFLFGFFMDFTIWLTKGLPEATSIVLIIVYLAISLILVALALLLYFTANLPTMPYDSLTYVIANTWKTPFSKAKITSDMLNVVLSLVICLLFIQSFGAIGIGTFIAAYGIGKMVGILLHKLQPSLKQWVYKNN